LARLLPAGAARADRPRRQQRAFPRRHRQGTTGEICKFGLHEFITGFVQDNDKLGATISEQLKGDPAQTKERVSAPTQLGHRAAHRAISDADSKSSRISRTAPLTQFGPMTPPL
jgi:hypothetical protein